MPKKTFFNLPPDKRQRIIDAAYDIFVEEEYEKVSIRAITKKAGISLGSFYKYFDDKDELYLYLLTSIEKKIYDKEKEFKGIFLLRKDYIPIEKICSKREIEFDKTWYKAPVEVMRKFYFGEYSKELNSIIRDELIELKNSGKLKDSLDIDFIFYLFVTLMFNILMYFREHNIEDHDEKLKIKNEFYTTLFLTGILKAE
ncbi:TetR/AcrR family transcriptional regulator [Lutispora saccharofermentans]|uniref:TetR/AcrR family transcriptional regulator n=1 Tax=Lutispora saccharofermentans TaxID=3024236 RepID=A0ABT1NHE3_9FIRM|nr:TetR/AcrR family transcriptional regulator [Lutispora saccharofermentans]MCQ1530653.1 TetR/AcrR family transcriptional regulator [Lutispora saccharofermentans]